MKTMTKLLAVIALALAVFGQHSSAGAGGGGGGQSYAFKGLSTGASFSSFSDCIITEAHLFATEAKVREAKGQNTPLSYASVTLIQYDFCTDTFLRYAYGSTVPLQAGEFQISKKLNAASLHTTINVFDEVSLNTFDVAVDLTWTGIGPLTSQHTNSHSNTPGCKIQSRFKGSFRAAQAWGTITDGVTNFTPEASYWASLDSVNNGQVVIGCI